MNGYKLMQQTFDAHELAVPPVPERLRGSIRQFGDWHWGTEPAEPMDMYMLHPYVDDLLTTPHDDHVAISHAGHSANSYSLNLGLVLGGLTLVVQTPWGGAHADPAAAASRWAELASGCGSVVTACEQAISRGDDSARLLVVDSDFRSVRVCVELAPDLSPIAALQELTNGRLSTDPLGDALRILGGAHV